MSVPIRALVPLLAILGFCLSAQSAVAQITMFGHTFTNEADLQTKIFTGDVWIVAGAPELAGCADAFKISTQDDTQNEAKVRYAAIRRYRECLALIRPSVIAGMTATNQANAFSAFQALDDVAQKKEVTAKAGKDFMGMTFGVGIGASFGSDDRVSDAKVGADGRIRVVKQETNEPRVILESHYYGFCKKANCKAAHFGYGPYFGLVAKDDKLISAISLGFMVGWKPDDDKADGFSIGIGAIMDSDVKSLASGFKEGQPLPSGETEIAYEEKSRHGAILFFTKTF